MSGTCDKIRKKLALYYYVELEAGDRAAVKDHLESCPACLGKAIEIGRLLGQVPRRAPDAAAIRRVTAGTMARLEKKQVRGLVLRLAPAFVAASVLATAILFFYSPLPQHNMQHAQTMQKLTAVEWEMIDNYDVVDDLEVIQGLEEFDVLEDAGADHGKTLS